MPINRPYVRYRLFVLFWVRARPRSPKWVEHVIDRDSCRRRCLALLVVALGYESVRLVLQTEWPVTA